MDARLVAHLADVAPQDWVEEIRRFDALADLLAMPRPDMGTMQDCADKLGLKVRATYRLLERQRAIRAGQAVGNRRLECSMISAASLVGRQWIIDERRFEVEDLRRLPFPYADWRDLLKQPITEMEAADTFTCYAQNAFGMPDHFAAAVEDHQTLREPFQNGKMDPSASEAARDDEIRLYQRFLSKEISRLLAGTPIHTRLARRSPGALEMRILFSPEGGDAGAESAAQDLGFPGFAEEGAVFLDDRGDHAIASIVKPDARPAWTVERAFADAINVVREVMG